MKNKVFISHATPDDNDFTKWLALKLISLGYEVWCDILFLNKGADFWSNIEKEIRESTFKFLIVSTISSNQREGVLKELAVAAKVKKELKDDNFIIPLAIDEKLSYDYINIDIIRLNAIDFKKSWASGLRELIEAFEKQEVPKNSPDPEKSNLLYQQIFLHDKGIIDKEEVYDSNWFPIISFPQELRFHEFGSSIPNKYDLRKLTFPAIRYKNYICTFAGKSDFVLEFPRTNSYDENYTIKIQTSEIFSNEYNSRFISNVECKRLIVQIINKAFAMCMKNKVLREYEMSNTFAYWIEKGTLEKDRYNKVQLVGRQKEKKWHFGISAAGKLYPFHLLMISSHILFTFDGVKLIETKSIQHSARRRQGQNWWNDSWRTKLLAFVKYISDDETSLFLDVGSKEKIQISNEPLKFVGYKSYIVPNESNLDEEAELAEMNDFSYLDEENDEMEVNE